MSVFKNRTLKKIFGTKMEDVMADWRRLHNVGLQDLRTVIGVIKSVIMRWGNAMRVREKLTRTAFLLVSLKATPRKAWL
jgi:hypothetical protein